MRRLIERLKDERGSVGVLLALAMFVVVGMLMLTLDTVQLSRAKMRVQNAADAAALEHATWQARGMNAVQNLNDEAYVVAETVTVLTFTSAGLESLAKGFDVAPPPFNTIFPTIFRGITSVLGGAGSLWGKRTVETFIPIMQHFFVYGSSLYGYFGAQQLAAANGALAITPELDLGKYLFLGDMKLGLHAVGLSVAHPLSTFVLPLRRLDKEECDLPLSCESLKGVFAGPGWPAYEPLNVGEGWTFRPFVSHGKMTDEEKRTRTERKERIRRAEQEMIAASNAYVKAEHTLREAEAQFKEALQKRRSGGAGAGTALQLRELQVALAVAKDKFKDAEKDLDAKTKAFMAAVRSPVPPVDYSGTDKGGLPGATIWVAFQGKKSIETFSLDAWSPGKTKDGLANAPFIALAAAKCISGEVVPHNQAPKDGVVNQRPFGFGTGATAKLVPVTAALEELRDQGETAGKIGEYLGKAFGTVIYH